MYLTELIRRQSPSPGDGSGTLNASSTPTQQQKPPTTDSPSSSKSGSSTTIIIVVVVVVVVVLIILSGIAYFVLRNIRRKHKDPKYVPTSFLKRRWKSWTPKPPSSKRNNNDHLEPISEANNRHSRSALSALNPSASVRAANQRANEAIDRHTSVRSVMTLPAYNPMARDTEQVLGREGERGGIDVVLEYPESDITAEQRREDEMEALYRVRLARRTEAAEREERRRLRREARERNDNVTLEQLRQQTQEASSTSNLESLRAEHERIRKRERAVSSVSYGDLGVARHDGTRIRANSEDSEQPLLGDAESMAVSSMHTRNRSRSSVVSIDTTDSDFPSPAFTRERANSRPGSSLRRMSMPNQEGSMSSPELVEAENDESVPEHEPPEYVDVALDDVPEAPPEYFSPIATRPPEFPPTQVESTAEVAHEEDDTQPGPHDAEMRQESGDAGEATRAPSPGHSSVPRITVDAATQE
ncbi:MAG: hypothetical protein M1818_002515 [Claussenomyces sp. TS43310]|nr:MAG: hypothetical protein M1818_002515 [Claussenomyces sp. TS43310]